MYIFTQIYNDNKNITPEYKILSSFNIAATRFSFAEGSRVKCIMCPTLENIGKRPVAIIQLDVSLYFSKDPGTKKYLFSTGDEYKGKNILIRPGNIWNDNIILLSHNTFGNVMTVKDISKTFNQHRKNMNTTPLKIFLSNGDLLSSNFQKL